MENFYVALLRQPTVGLPASCALNFSHRKNPSSTDNLTTLSSIYSFFAFSYTEGMGPAFLALAILTLPALMGRFVYRKEPASRVSLTGVFQDFFIGAQLLFLLWFLPKPVSYFLFPTLQFIILFDSLLYRQLSLRMEPSFFLLLPHLGEYRDSARELKFFKFLPGIVALSALPVIFLTFFPALIFLPTAVLGGTILGGFYLLKDKPPKLENLFYQYQKRVWRKCVSFFRSESEQPHYSDFVQEILLSKSEIYSAPSSTYPLFRYTEAFRGKKVFDLKIEEGEKPHVIFLFLESFRAKEAGCLGSKLGVTPHFDALAEKGTLFSQFYSNSILTIRAVVSALYGVPFHLDLVNEIDPQLPLIGVNDVVKNAGYQTNCFTGASLTSGNLRAFLNQRGVDTLCDKKEICEHFPEAKVTSWGIPDEYLFSYASEHLEKHANHPQFYSLFTISNHHPWILPTDYEAPDFSGEGGDFYQRYLKTLHYSDHCLGEFIRNLREKGLMEKTLLFVLGDHGICFGKYEEGYDFRQGHAEENFHVPLLIYSEGRNQIPQVIDTPSCHFDLLPTLMDMLHLQGFNIGMGHSLQRESEKRTFFFHNPASEGPEICCRQGIYKGVFFNRDESLELYDVKKDPMEEINLAGELPEIETYLGAHFRTYRNFLYALYDHQTFIPPSYQKLLAEDRPGQAVHCSPSPKLSREALLVEIKEKSPLFSLNLPHHPALTDEVLEKIACLNPFLGRLALNANLKISDQGVWAVARECQFLAVLDLSECLLLTENVLGGLLDEATELEVLGLNGLDIVSDEAIRNLKNSYPTLKTLLISRTSLTDEGLGCLPRLFPKLLSLQISFSQITARELRDCIDQLPLTYLSLIDCEGMVDDDFLLLTQNTPFLRFLTLENCDRLTDQAFERLKNSPLKGLYLLSVPGLTDKGVAHLQRLPLRVLHIKDCPNISEEGLNLLKTHAGQYDDLHIETLPKHL